jgi:hypothetical protein
MRRSAALALVLVAAGCGGHSTPKHALTPTLAKSRPVPIVIKVTIAAPTHHPKAGKRWPVTVHVTDTAGKPLPARLTMRILFGGRPVGKVDNGRVYRFVGTWRERKGNEITWPAASRGEPLEFEAIVTAQHTTVRRTWAIEVR